ncbi:SPOR domain-containing protein [Sporolactobacillus shoreicorticis]|uniref:SPOR domain-containing protein n=1 Tax=Sporolactobacillus shoreicorticis TaxID=1923877 RepID=A0ABW5S2U9_9BACL|nr:SPOR domain-containing protein [Sporolactobacillus shoreicorticis]MCO7128299.1 SPOR domain-containing protein [Sporolactobacillus shoreicorticis]
MIIHLDAGHGGKDSGTTSRHETSEEINTTTTYSVQIGAFKDRKKADLLVKKAEKTGFKPFIERSK